MESVTIIVERNLFPALAERLPGAVTSMLDGLVPAVLQVAAPETRVRTGALVSTQSVEATGVSRTITWDMFYAIYQDLGTYKMTGTHFAEAGIDGAAPKALPLLLAAWGVS